jgi:hypothetical protein
MDAKTSKPLFPLLFLMLMISSMGRLSAQEIMSYENVALMNSNEFKAEDIDLERILLSWTVQAGSEVDHFIIERSENTKVWELVRTLPGPTGHTDQLQFETVDSEAILGDSFYRLTQVDAKGVNSFVAMANAVVKKRPSVEFFPNPARGIVTIYADDPDLMDVELVDSAGRHVRAYVDRFGEVMQINVENLKPGTYMLHVSSPARSDIQPMVIY